MERLRTMLLDKGACQVGYGDLEKLSPNDRRHLRYGVSIAVALDPLTVIGMEYDPAANFDADYNRVNDLLDDLATWTVRFLQEQGHIAIALPVAPEDYDQTTLSTHLPHKTVATRAGLGWIGKCALLITPDFGSAIRITSVLTNAELPVAEPIDASRCGECDACLKVCPGHAPTGADWKAGMDREQYFNAFSCRQTRSDLAREAFVKTARCGMCIAVCPYSREYVSRMLR